MLLKKILLTMLSILFYTSCAQMFVHLDGDNGHYEKVADHQLLREDAHKIAFTWIATNFNSANDVVQFNDEDEGKLILQAVGSFPAGLGTTLSFRYTLTIKNKDNKVKYTFDTGNLVGYTYAPVIDYQPEVFGYYQSVVDRLNVELGKGIIDEDNF